MLTPGKRIHHLYQSTDIARYVCTWYEHTSVSLLSRLSQGTYSTSSSESTLEFGKVFHF